MTTTADARAQEYRTRLLNGMAAAVAEVGYGSLTIADVVRHARVSRRTFYEQFRSKEECLLALYAAESERVLATVRAALEGAAPGETRIRAGVEAYLAELARRPALAQTLLVEILAAGEPGLEVRRAVNRRFARQLQHQTEPQGEPLSPALAMALVGGINELILEAVEEGRVRELAALAGPITALLRAVLG